MSNHGGKRPGAGRPKGFAALEAERQRDLVAKKLVTEFEPIVDKAIEQAKGGDKFAREWLSDRAYGKSTQLIGGDESAPLEIAVITGMKILKDGDTIQDEESQTTTSQ